MILVADSGSTKCDWLLENPAGDPFSFSTMGFNPLFHASEFIAAEIHKNEALVAHAANVTDIYYYGASVSSADRKEIVERALRAVFPSAALYVEHDLTGAARATCGNSAGIACILGTGSNSCYFDGVLMDDSIPALGYILGDEAGGAWFGREFLKRYLYGLFPEIINKTIEETGAVKEEIYRRVYRREGANVYLASFMPLIYQFRNDAIVADMLKTGFEAFLLYHVKPFSDVHQVPVHFVGSIAVHFKSELLAVCDSMHIKTGIFTNKPIDNLFQYHIKHAQL